MTILEQARQAGCKTIGISSNPEAKLQRFSDIFINPVVGEEALTGSSRMKSGTAQKMILNMLSTGAMIRIGKTYENYMIDVRLMNEKLFDAARVSSRKSPTFLMNRPANTSNNAATSKPHALWLQKTARRMRRKNYWPLPAEF